MTGFVIAIVESPLYQKHFMPVIHSENKNTFGVRCTPYLSTGGRKAQMRHEIKYQKSKGKMTKQKLNIQISTGLK